MDPNQPQRSTNPQLEPTALTPPTEAVSQGVPAATPPQPTTNDSPPQPQPTVYTTPTYAASTNSYPTAPSKKPLLLVIVGVILLAALVGGLVFALGGKDEAPASKASTPSSDSVTSPSENESPQTDAAGKTIPLNKTITDDEMGYTITATSMGIGNFAVPERFKESNSDKTVVTIHFKNTDSNKFSGSAKDLVLRLITSDGEIINSTSLSDDDLKAAGLTPLNSATESNDIVEGDMAYWVDSDKLGSFTLRYKRTAATIMGSNQAIPAKDFDVLLF